MQKRIDEHKRDIEKKTPTSAVYQHYRQTGHQMQWRTPAVLQKECDPRKRKFLEASYSVTDGNSINRHIDVHPVYIPLITSLVKQ